MVTIWRILTDSKWRSGYRRILNAQGYTVRATEEILQRMTMYVIRLKDSPFAIGLKRTNDLQQFKDKLDEIFNVKWKGYIQSNYADMYGHFMAYLGNIEVLEATHGEFYNEEEKSRLIKGEKGEATELTNYEQNYIRDGKLKALMNPYLLYSIKRRIDNGTMTITEASRFCYSYYMKFLPDMNTNDYSALIKEIWFSDASIKSGSCAKRLSITFPDGSVEKTKGVEAIKQTVKFYGADSAYAKKLKIAGHILLAKRGIHNEERSKYEDLNEHYIVFKQGKFKDVYNVINALNCMLGKKLKIEIVSN